MQPIFFIKNSGKQKLGLHFKFLINFNLKINKIEILKKLAKFLILTRRTTTTTTPMKDFNFVGMT